MGIKAAAALARVPLDSVEVEVEMDWDNRSMFGAEGVPPDPVATRLTISVQSPADEKLVRQIIDDGLRNDAWLQIALRPQNIEQSIQITRSSS